MRPMTVLILGLLALCISACSDSQLSQPMQIFNRTTSSIEIAYHVPLSTGADSIFTTLEMTSNGFATFGVPSYDKSGCGNGTLIATSGAVELARLDRPCPSQIWEIVSPTPS